MIGMFGLSEALMQLHDLDKTAIKQRVDNIIPKWSDIQKYLPCRMQSSAIGVVIGALPGTGGDIAALMAYDHAKRVTKNPEVPFGQGAKEGIVAPRVGQQRGRRRRLHPDADAWHPRRCGHGHHHRRAVHQGHQSRPADADREAAHVLVHGRQPDARPTASC